ncbi:MAG: exopolyphosphatase, partial [Nitriliruptoraceae bacterium]
APTAVHHAVADAVGSTATEVDGAAEVGASAAGAASPPTAERSRPSRRLPLGTLAGARSGDKGGDANVGVWVRDQGHYPWLLAVLGTADQVRGLLPEAAHLDIDVHPLPNLLAVNVVIHGLLGEGVAASTRPDPQAKGLGEFLRSRPVEVPVALLPDGHDDAAR